MKQIIISDELIDYYRENYGKDLLSNSLHSGKPRVYYGPILEKRGCLWFFPHTSLCHNNPNELYFPLKRGFAVHGGLSLGNLTPISHGMFETHAKRLKVDFEKDGKYKNVLAVRLKVAKQYQYKLKIHAKRMLYMPPQRREYLQDTYGEHLLYDFKKLSEIALDTTLAKLMLKSKTSDAHVLLHS